MTDTPKSPAVADAARALEQLAQTDRRAQLKALLPLLDSLVCRGVSYDAISQTLQKLGLVMAPPAIRQALYRWRKRQPSTITKSSSSLPLSTPAKATTPLSRTASSATKQPSISNKADLVKLRTSKEPIDLNALAELGRQK